MQRHRTARIVATLLFIAAAIVFAIGLIFTFTVAGSGLGGGWGPGTRAWLVVPILAGTILNAAGLLVIGAIVYFLVQIDENLRTTRDKRAAGLQAAIAPEEPKPSRLEPSHTPSWSHTGADVTAQAAAAEAQAAADEAKLAAATVPPEGIETPTVTTVDQEVTQRTEAEVVESETTVVTPVEPEIPGETTETESTVQIYDANGEPLATETTEAKVDQYQVVQGQEAAGESLDETELDEGEAPEFTGKLPGTEEAARISNEMAALGETPGQADDLLAIQGIGPLYAERLHAAGIKTFEQLAAADDAKLAEVTDGNLERVLREDWRGQARQLSKHA